MRSVVIVEPEIPENTGFIARLAANFNFQIRLVNPGFNLEEAKDTASRAQDKLREAEIYETVEEAVDDLDFVVGTKPEKGKALGNFQPREDTSLMIGRESSGLTNDELALCDATIHIETGEYESINQSHAAAIIMQKFHRKEEKQGISQGQKEIIRDMVPEKIYELILEANPSRDEVNNLIGQIKNED